MSIISCAKPDRRLGDWILTYSGVEFWPLDCRLHEILIEDIAVPLSRLPRYTGHTKFNYVVGQHSIYVAELLLPYGNRIALAGLLHDGSEAYFNDTSNPLKYLPEYKIIRRIDRRLQEQIFKKFGLNLSKDERKLIKRTDKSVFAAEVPVLMYPNDKMRAKAARYKAADIDIHPMDEYTVYKRFMRLFRTLLNFDAAKPQG